GPSTCPRTTTDIDGDLSQVSACDRYSAPRSRDQSDRTPSPRSGTGFGGSIRTLACKGGGVARTTAAYCPEAPMSLTGTNFCRRDETISATLIWMIEGSRKCGAR